MPLLPGALSGLADSLRVVRELPTFRAFRHRSFRLYFFGQLVSLTGTWMQTTTLLWLAFQITNTSRWPAYVIAAQALPIVLLGAWGGTIADRWARRNVLLVTQALLTILALVLAAVVYFLPPSAWLLVLLAGAAGVIQSVDWPARLSFVFDMVGREDLVNAVGLSSLLFNVARAIGPAIAGLLIAHSSPALCFLINAFSYGATLLALTAMRLRPPADREEKKKHATLGAGFRLLLQRKRLLIMLLLTGAIAMFGWPAQALLPALSTHQLGAHPEGYGWMLSAIGGGALIASLVVASSSFHPSGMGEERTREQTLLGAGAALAIAALLLLSLTTSLLLAVAACAFLGMGMILFLATSQAITQLSAGDHNRGAIMGIWSMILGGVRPIGHLLAGWAADHWSAPVVLGLAGVCICLTALVAVCVVWRLQITAATDPDRSEPPSNAPQLPAS